MLSYGEKYLEEVENQASTRIREEKVKHRKNYLPAIRTDKCSINNVVPLKPNVI